MSFNKITIIGNLGRDPELRYTPAGDAVCDFSVAVNDRKRDKAGEWHDVTTWFKVTFWRKQAENASKYLTKGRQVYVEGRLEVDEWSDRDGKNRHSLAIQGTELQFLGGREDEASFQHQHLIPLRTTILLMIPNNSNGSSDVINSPSDDDIPF